MKNFDKYIEMLGDFNSTTVLGALIHALQYGDETSYAKDETTYQSSFAFVNYTPCIDTITAKCSIRNNCYYTFTIRYSNDVMEAVNVGEAPLVNETFCFLFNSIDDITEYLNMTAKANANHTLHNDMSKWLDMVAKKIRTEFIAAHAFIDVNEEAQEAEKKIAEKQEAMKNANAEENKDILKDSVLKFIDHIYDYESDKDVLAKVRSEIKNVSSEAFSTIVDGLSNAAKELSSRLDELQNKMDPEKTEADDTKTPDPDATANEGEVKEEKSECNYCGGTCHPGCPATMSDDEDEDYWGDDDDDWDDFDIAEVVEEHITASLLMSVHHKLMHTKDTSITGDIASNFFYDCFEKAAVRLRENKLRIDTMRRGTPLGGSYELEVYDRTTNKVVWCQTFDLLNVTPEMIKIYDKKINGHKYTTADFSTTDVRAMIFMAILGLIREEINEKELELAISFVEGWNNKSETELKKIRDHMTDWFDYGVMYCFNNTGYDLTKIRTDAIPELKEYIKKHDEDEEDDNE